MPFKDPEKQKASHAKWQKNNPEKAKATSRAACRKWRAKNVERERERMRRYHLEHREAEAQKRRAWRTSPEGKAWMKKYRLEHLSETKARRFMGHKVESGQVVKPARCSRCGLDTPRLQAHHENYRRPEEVEWLCAACHGLTRRAARRSANQPVVGQGD